MHFGFYITEDESQRWLHGELSDFDLLSRCIPERVSSVYWVGSVKDMRELLEVRRFIRALDTSFVFRTKHPIIKAWTRKKIHQTGKTEADGAIRIRCSLLSDTKLNCSDRPGSIPLPVGQSGRFAIFLSRLIAIVTLGCVRGAGLSDSRNASVTRTKRGKD